MNCKYDTFASNGDIPTELNETFMLIMPFIQLSLEGTKQRYTRVAHHKVCQYLHIAILVAETFYVTFPDLNSVGKKINTYH